MEEHLSAAEEDLQALCLGRACDYDISVKRALLTPGTEHAEVEHDTFPDRIHQLEVTGATRHGE